VGVLEAVSDPWNAVKMGLAGPVWGPAMLYREATKEEHTGVIPAEELFPIWGKYVSKILLRGTLLPLYTYTRDRLTSLAIMLTAGAVVLWVVFF